MNNIYPLTITPDYVGSWGVWEGLREFLQNAMDHGEFSVDISPQVGGESYAITIKSHEATLDKRTLLMGQSTKGEGDRGKFGEGYKLGALALIRAGKMVVIRNGMEDWEPIIWHNPFFEAEVLAFRASARGIAAPDLTFYVGDLTEEEVAMLRERCLALRESSPARIEVASGAILPGDAGKFFVGGLFVCDTQMLHGYDARPGRVELERDRQTVSGFNLRWLTCEMWKQSQRPEEVAAMAEAKAPDVAMLEYGTTTDIAEACFRLFTQKHPGAVAVQSQEELDRLVKSGMTNTVYVGEAFYHSLNHSSDYKKATSELVRVQSPLDVVREWIRANAPDADAVELLAAAATWRVK